MCYLYLFYGLFIKVYQWTTKDSSLSKKEKEDNQMQEEEEVELELENYILNYRNKLTGKLISIPMEVEEE